jgi:DNA invertase Pin-like site-specific DNA recombinase
MVTERKPDKQDSVNGAVIYCRVSTAEQVENNSLPNQKKSCIEYCERNSFEVAKVFVDGGERQDEKSARLARLD